MSAFGVIYQRDRDPLPATAGAEMSAALARQPADSGVQWQADYVGIAQRALCATPGATATPSLYDNETRCAIALTGHIDNRDELLRALGQAQKISDAALVLSAYQRWGEECPAHLTGEFAFVLWDERRQQLFCARDHLGLKPFYYYADERRFSASSEIAALFATDTIPRAANEGIIGELLATASINSRTETIYRDVWRLPGGHCLTVQARKWHLRAYWQPETISKLPARADSEYAEEFWSILREAVRCRWRGRAGVLLSGGLDSSSVAATARALLGPDAEIETFSQTYPGRECDESSYIAENAAFTGLKTHLFPFTGTVAGRYEEDVRRYHDLPDYPNDAMWDDLRAGARERGQRVLLTGAGGDEWLTGSLFHNADYLRRGHWGRLWQQAGHDAAQYRLSGRMRSIWSYGVKPLLPKWVRPAYRRLRRRQARPPEWISPDLARRTGLLERIDTPPPCSRGSLARRELAEFAQSGWLARALEMHSRLNARYGLDFRHPFHDRRLIEFALGLPENQRWRGPETKFILRRVMSGRLPEKIRTRADKSDFLCVFATELEKHAGSAFFQNLQLAERGWIEPGPVKAMYRRLMTLSAANDRGTPWRAWQLWRIYGLELLVRARLL